LSGPLTLDTVADHYRASETLFAGDAVSAVDLGKVSKVDSAGLALLLEWQAMARKRGNRLAFRHAPQDLLRLAALAEASELLGLPPVPEFAHQDLD
jgi:phospholipid transport system transporter-binding protein